MRDSLGGTARLGAHLTLNNSIDNTWAGSLWLVLGGLAVGWYGQQIRNAREDGVRMWWQSGSEVDPRGCRLTMLAFGVMGTWLAVYLILDWIF